MLGWSLNLFRIRGIQLAVHASFFLLLAYFAQEGWQEGGTLGMVWTTLTIVAFFGCVVLHELGHSFTALHFGVGVRRILLMPIGGMAEFDTIPRQPSRELLITLAGPAVNFVIAGGLWLIVRKLDDDSFPPVNPLYSLPGLAYELFWGNLVMGCFNLLPAFPMDGGRIFRALLATKLPYVRATWIAATVGKVVAGIGALVALFVFHRGLSAALFVFIFFAGEMEYRAVRRREHDDAHWRAVLARVYGAPPPASEPPVIGP